MSGALKLLFFSHHAFSNGPSDSDVLRRVSGALGWAAMLDILLLFYPVARSSFLHCILGRGFSTLIKYHRRGLASCEEPSSVRAAELSCMLTSVMQVER